MGIGFVLIVFLFLGLVGSLVAGGIAALICGMMRRRWPAIRFVDCMIVFAFPFLCLGFCGVSFVGYAVFCQTVRGVDPGIGDGFQVPLGHGFSLMMIDTTDSAFIQSPENDQPYFDKVAKIGKRGDVVAFEQESEAFVLFDTSNRRTKRFPDEASFYAAAGVDGIPASSIVSTEGFYQEHRWSIIDVLFPVVVFGAIAAATAMLARWILLKIRHPATRYAD